MTINLPSNAGGVFFPANRVRLRWSFRVIPIDQFVDDVHVAEWTRFQVLDVEESLRVDPSRDCVPLGRQHQTGAPAFYGRLDVDLHPFPQGQAIVQQVVVDAARHYLVELQPFLNSNMFSMCML